MGIRAVRRADRHPTDRRQTSHDHFSLLGIGRNVLDLGIFGPAGHELGNAEGFRGWSGGARAGFMLSATNATPGYLTGPIDPGQWALALGPVVLNPLGMDWRAQIVLTRGVQPSIRRLIDPVRWRAEVAESAGTVAIYIMHTVHSDGRHRIADMAAAATSAGLDFIVSTDHNTSSANRALAATTGDGLLVVAGEEVTTRHGHWLAVGLPPGGGLTGGMGREMASSSATPLRFAPEGDWSWPHIRRCRCRVALGSSATATWMRWKSGTAYGTSMTNCRCAFGINSCARAAGSLRSAAATLTDRTNRSVGRRPSCTPRTCRRVASWTRCGGADATSPNRAAVTLQLNASHDDGTTTSGLGETLECRPAAT